MRFIRMIVLLAPFTVAIADEPTPPAAATTAPAPPAAAAPAAPARAPAATASPASAAAPATAAAQPDANPAPPPTAAAQAAARAALLKKGRMLGYHPVERNGQTVYCHNEAPLGSRFEKTSCLSEDDLVAAMQRRDAMQDDMSRPGTCGRAGCVTH